MKLEDKKELKKQWGFSARNKYEQQNKQISKSEKKNIEKNLVKDNNININNKVEEKYAINISSKQKDEKDKTTQEIIEATKKEKIISKEFDIGINIIEKTAKKNNKEEKTIMDKNVKETKGLEEKKNLEKINIPLNDNTQKVQNKEKIDISIRKKIFPLNDNTQKGHIWKCFIILKK